MPRPRGFVFGALAIVLALSIPGAALAASMTAARDAKILVAPAPDSPVLTTMRAGDYVEATHQAGTYWRVELSGGRVGYVPVDALKQAQTRGLFLIPIVIALVAEPLGKYVSSKGVEWFGHKSGLDKVGKDKEKDKADKDKGDKEKKEGEPGAEPRPAPGAEAGQIPPGSEITILGKEPDGSYRIRLANGSEVIVKDLDSFVPLRPVTYADASTQQVYQNAAPIPTNANGLGVGVEVRRVDGALIPPNGTLRLGEAYRIYVTPTADAYVRITAETPDKRNVCQYYPNHFQGTQSSQLLKAGHTYSTEFLPNGVAFKVDEPLGAKDILRVEATTASPFTYVSEGDGCASTVKYRGGGFSQSGPIRNPTAQIVVEFPIVTTK